MKTILCYGDSNTWGFVPGSFVAEPLFMERYPRNKRWTGILQSLLGSDYYVVEEGLNGRTTNVDYQELVNRNGKTFLPVCLYAHSPIDLVVLMLGPNDLKVEFNRTSDDVMTGISELLEIIKISTFGSDMKQSPQVLLVSPPEIVHEEGFNGVFKGAMKRGADLGSKLNKLADKNGCYFLDACLHVSCSKIDGVHLSAAGHELFARAIYKTIKMII
jgi:lysophospholipase L1-like esterase